MKTRLSVKINFEKIVTILRKIILIIICFAIFSCKKETASLTSDISIGENYGGGIVFFVDGTGQHGLISATSNCSDSMQWYNGIYISTNARGNEVGKGHLNTEVIINAQGDGDYAANLCDKLVLNGYSDWFLPSKNELDLLYQQRGLVGGFTNDYYWSSSEYDTINVWNQYFPYGPRYYANKSDKACVRAIRAF